MGASSGQVTSKEGLKGCTGPGSTGEGVTWGKPRRKSEPDKLEKRKHGGQVVWGLRSGLRNWTLSWEPWEANGWFEARWWLDLT